MDTRVDKHTVVHHTPDNPNIRAAEQHNIKEGLGRNVRHVYYKYERVDTGRRAESRARAIQKYPELLKDYSEVAREQSRAPPERVSYDIKSGLLARDIRAGGRPVMFQRPPALRRTKSVVAERVRSERVMIARGYDSPRVRAKKSGFLSTGFIDDEIKQSQERRTDYFRIFAQERRLAASSENIMQKRYHAQKAGLYKLAYYAEGLTPSMMNWERGTREEIREHPGRFAANIALAASFEGILAGAGKVATALKLKKFIPASAVKWALPTTYLTIKGGQYSMLPKGERAEQFGRDLSSEILPFVVGGVALRRAISSPMAKKAAWQAESMFTKVKVGVRGIFEREELRHETINLVPNFRYSEYPKPTMDYGVLNPNEPASTLYVGKKTYYKLIRRHAQMGGKLPRTKSVVGGLNILRQNALRDMTTDSRLSKSIIHDARVDQRLARKRAAERFRPHIEFVAEKGVTIPDKPLSLMWKKIPRMGKQGKASIGFSILKPPETILKPTETVKFERLRERSIRKGRIMYELRQERLFKGRTRIKVTPEEEIVIKPRFAILPKETATSKLDMISKMDLSQADRFKPSQPDMIKSRSKRRPTDRIIREAREQQAFLVIPQLKVRARAGFMPSSFQPELPKQETTPPNPLTSIRPGATPHGHSTLFKSIKRSPKRTKKKSKVKLKTFKTGYMPSLTALEFNIKSYKIPRMSVKSGITVRPILIR